MCLLATRIASTPAKTIGKSPRGTLTWSSGFTSVTRALSSKKQCGAKDLRVTGCFRGSHGTVYVYLETPQLVGSARYLNFMDVSPFAAGIPNCCSRLHFVCNIHEVKNTLSCRCCVVYRENVHSYFLMQWMMLETGSIRSQLAVVKKIKQKTKSCATKC